MKTITKLFLPVLCLLTTYGIGQTTFERMYNFDNGCHQYGYQVSEIDTNQFLFLNSINCNMFGESVDLIKVNQFGDTLLSSSFGYSHNTGTDYFIQTGNSFVIPITSTSSNNDGFTTILKVDSELHEVWHTTFSIPGVNISCGRVIQTSDGGYILGGYSNLNLGPNQDFIIIKLNSNGDSLWTKIFNFNSDDVNVYSIIEEGNGSLIFTGGLYSYSSGNKGALIFKTDSVGDSLISKTYRNFNEGLFMSKWRNEFVVGGDYQDSISATSNGFVLFLDSNLDSISSFLYGTGLNEGISSGTTDSNEFIVTGTIFNSNYQFGKLSILKFDTNNVLVNSKVFYHPAISSPYSTISKTSDDGLILGSTTTDSLGFKNSLLIKTDMNGAILSTPEIPMTTSEIISPNPSKGIFYLNGKNPVKKCTVYSILGKKIREFSGNEMDLSGYEEGIYFYEAEFFSGLVQKGKLIKIN